MVKIGLSSESVRCACNQKLGGSSCCDFFCQNNVAGGCYFPSSFSVEIFTDASADDVQPCSFLLENSTPRYVTVLFDEYCRLLFRKLKELYVTSVCNA
ncbi:uncharacterized protein LOC130765955 isoform X2 [Actinidia eriantha]|uniref:uncharacterized protein LOC130765955 isoform X2 n=1 Tax=Actinidia eriantha TaxID=165200 RepID=UPI00258F51F4|nr:uncharacterized protein LOC130765955 isoform X2 [Actinidia eriantha]